MNLELYGWTSPPLVGFLFRVFGADCGSAAKWCRPVLWVSSASLGVGVLSCLSGESRGKLFLDWSGYARFLFPSALLMLWLVLAFAIVASWSDTNNAAVAARMTKLVGLAILLAVPFVIYIASSSSTYPPVNPDTGGPTGASQLESSLAVVAILLLLPFGLARRLLENARTVAIAWILLAAESVLCIAMGRAGISHHQPHSSLP